jgi:hypothetical protein
MRFGTEHVIFWCSFVITAILPWVYVAKLLHDAPAVADVPPRAQPADLRLAAAGAAGDKDSGCMLRCVLQGEGGSAELRSCREMCARMLQASQLQLVNGEEVMLETCKEHCVVICMPQCPVNLRDTNCKRQCDRQCASKCRNTKKGEWRKWRRAELPGAAVRGLRADRFDGPPQARSGSTTSMERAAVDGTPAADGQVNSVGAGGAYVPLFI